MKSIWLFGSVALLPFLKRKLILAFYEKWFTDFLRIFTRTRDSLKAYIYLAYFRGEIEIPIRPKNFWDDMYLDYSTTGKKFSCNYFMALVHKYITCLFRCYLSISPEKKWMEKIEKKSYIGAIYNYVTFTRAMNR